MIAIGDQLSAISSSRTPRYDALLRNAMSGSPAPSNKLTSLLCSQAEHENENKNLGGLSE